MCKITDLFRIRIYINKFFESYYPPPMCAKLFIIPKLMCSNTIQNQVIMNINNQDTFLQLYYARNVILGK